MGLEIDLKPMDKNANDCINIADDQPRRYMSTSTFRLNAPWV